MHTSRSPNLIFNFFSYVILCYYSFFFIDEYVVYIEIFRPSTWAQTQYFEIILYNRQRIYIAWLLSLWLLLTINEEQWSNTTDTENSTYTHLIGISKTKKIYILLWWCTYVSTYSIYAKSTPSATQKHTLSHDLW